ncbi:MAG: hypothetical protein AAFY20_21955 [Cyanobacteria bacterium J06639_14]
MQFPLWRYLNQPLWDEMHPITLNPFAYWQQYKVWYLDRCFDNAFLEECWNISYQDFIGRYQTFCSCAALEEAPMWLLDSVGTWQDVAFAVTPKPHCSNPSGNPAKPEYEVGDSGDG